MIPLDQPHKGEQARHSGSQAAQGGPQRLSRPSENWSIGSSGQSRHFEWEDGFAVFKFGKFKQQSVESVAAENPSYLQWMLRQPNFPGHVLDVVHEALMRNSTALH